MPIVIEVEGQNPVTAASCGMLGCATALVGCSGIRWSFSKGLDLRGGWQRPVHGKDLGDNRVDALTLFVLIAVAAMLICYALEKRSHWFILAFAASCAMGSVYGFLQGAWPFGLVESVCSAVAARR